MEAIGVAIAIGGAAGGAAATLLAGAWWLFSQIQAKHDGVRDYVDRQAKELHERIDEIHGDFVKRHDLARVEKWLEKIDGRLDRLIDGKP